MGRRSTQRSALGRALIRRITKGVESAAFQVIAFSEVEYTWRNEGDERVRDSHKIDGERRSGGEPFSCGARYPRDPEAPPEEAINCRCWLEVE
jgi:uncharacterized protein with gpF-like domain